MKSKIIILAFLITSLLLGSSCSENKPAKESPTICAPRALTPEIAAYLTESNDFKFNKDYKARDKLLGINIDWSKAENGGIEPFQKLDVVTFEQLIKQKHVNPAEIQNESPTAKEFFIFMMKYPQVQAYGYAVSPFRGDYSVRIEGLFVPSQYVTEQLKKNFLDFCKGADQLSTDGDLRSWWD